MSQAGVPCAVVLISRFTAEDEAVRHVGPKHDAVLAENAPTVEIAHALLAAVFAEVAFVRVQAEPDFADPDLGPEDFFAIAAEMPSLESAFDSSDEESEPADWPCAASPAVSSACANAPGLIFSTRSLESGESSDSSEVNPVPWLSEATMGHIDERADAQGGLFDRFRERAERGVGLVCNRMSAVDVAAIRFVEEAWYGMDTKASHCVDQLEGFVYDHAAAVEGEAKAASREVERQLRGSMAALEDQSKAVAEGVKRQLSGTLAAVEGKSIAISQDAKRQLSGGIAAAEDKSKAVARKAARHLSGGMAAVEEKTKILSQAACMQTERLHASVEGVRSKTGGLTQKALEGMQDIVQETIKRLPVLQGGRPVARHGGARARAI